MFGISRVHCQHKVQKGQRVSIICVTELSCREDITGKASSEIRPAFPPRKENPASEVGICISLASVCNSIEVILAFIGTQINLVHTKQPLCIQTEAMSDVPSKDDIGNGEHAPAIRPVHHALHLAPPPPRLQREMGLIGSS